MYRLDNTMSSAEPQPEARFAGVAATNAAGIELGESWWVKEVRRRMEADTEELGAVAKVFDVPRLLRATKPEAYTPQHFALGPYHHQRTKLRDMERCKLAAAKRVQKEFAPNRFDDLVTKFDSIKDMIRAPYHRFLEVNDQTLTWMMAIDTCFLLDFLQDYYDQTAKHKVSSSTNWINATARDAMVRDTMMLENQIPMSLFFQTIQLQPISNEDRMRTVLEHFITDVSPIKPTTPALIGNIAEHGHLLELLYHFLVPDYDAATNPMVGDEDEGNSAEPHVEEQKGTLKWVCMHVSSSLHFPPILFIKRLISKIMKKVPLLSAAAELLGTFMASTDEAVQCGDVKQATIIKSPLAEEIMIPSVAQLAACGVRFTPSPKGLYAINFDPATATLTLPILHLDSNTDVILRNLVAYETAAVRGPLVLARYTELMNGIIDTPKDVKILVDCHIVSNRMKSNKEAADMWNGMCRAVRPTMVPHLDRVIREVNEHRNQNKAVKARRLLRRYVFRSWRLLTLVAAIVLLLMMSLQTFCTIYDCRRWLGHGIPQLPQLMPEGGQ